MLSKKTLYAVLLIALLGGILMFGFLGMYPLTDPDEPVYAETAKEMIAFGDYVSPRIYGEFWYDKPPMYYWLVAGAFQLFGVGEFAARFPSAVFALGGALFLYLAGRRLVGERAGLLASLILLTSLEYFYLGNGAVTDMTLTVFLTASLVAFWHRKYYIMYGCCALATLTKGPVAIFLVGVIVGAYLLLSHDIRRLKSMKIPEGIVIFGVIALPWYGMMYLLHGREFIDTFLGFHNVTRFLKPEHDSGAIWYYYLPVLAIGFFPWSSCLVQSIFGAVRERGEARGVCRFLTIWAAVVLIFFSASQTKLVSYILPMYPPIALLVGMYFDRIWTLRQIGALCRAAIIFAVLGIVLSGGVLYAATVFPEMWEATIGLTVILMIAAVGAVWQSVKRRFWAVFAIQLVGMTAFLIVLMSAAVPVIIDEFSVQPLVRAVESSYDGQSKLYIEKFYRPGIMYYTDLAGEELPIDALSTLVKEESEKTYFIMKNKRYDQLDDAAKSKVRILAQAKDKMLLVLEKRDHIE